MKYMKLILIRPRARRYAHQNCLSAEEAERYFKNRSKLVPEEDAEFFGNCLLCDKPLNQHATEANRLNKEWRGDE